MSGYTTNEVSGLIGLKPTQVRHYVRRSLIKPARGERGEFRFNFQDVVLLRTAKGLLEAKVSSRRTFQALLKVRSALDEFKSLAAVRIYAEGDDVRVQDRNEVWDVTTGQKQLDFQDAAPAVLGVPNLRDENLIVTREVDRFDSDEWYNLGLDLEEMDPSRAAEAYARAIELNPRHADAHVNLGRVLQLRNDLKRAKRHYELALAVVPEHQLALYNLGTLFDELDEIVTAAEYYRRAPGVPDAHYNLSRISELLGDELAARRHMRDYRHLIEVD